MITPDTSTVVDKVFRWIWRFTVFGITAYAVFWLNHTGWWFLFAMLISGMITFNSDKKK